MYFNKKLSIVFIACTLLGLIITSLAVLFPEKSISFVYDFLSQKVYHREFSIGKWKATLESFCLIPGFLVIFFNAVFFSCYRDKSKLILLITVLLDILFVLIYSLFVNYPYHVDSDLASELLLAKECIREKNFWPLGWYYATEVRVLNTQLIATPLFLIFSDWNTVKALTSLIALLILGFVFWKYLEYLKIKSVWIKLLCCIFIIAPFSEREWYTMGGENYYIPHVVMQFIYVTTFLKLCFADISEKSKKRTEIFFYIWAFICGISTIRYIINFLFPLFLTILTLKLTDKENKAKITDIKEFWLKDTKLFYATLGMFIGGFGYICNATVLQALYTFSHWEKITFNTLGQFSLTTIIISVFKIFGYQNNVGVFSPLGVIDIFLYVGITIFVVFYVQSMKHDLPSPQKIFLAYAAITFACNVFVLFSTEFKNYHLLPVTINLIPALAIMLENESLSSLKRWALGLTWSTLLITSSFATIQYMMTTDENADKHAVIHYLENSEYRFGYATFWNANIVTYLTNGKIEIAGQDKDRVENGHLYINPKYDPDIWLCPKRYFDKDYHGNEKIFFLVSNDEYEVSSELPVFAAGTVVYQDDFYRVYEYENKARFIESF